MAALDDAVGLTDSVAIRLNGGRVKLSGGTVYDPGVGDGRLYHRITTTGSVSPVGGPIEVEALVVAGGGGGGGEVGGGGGAGGVVVGTTTISGPESATVGSGGAGGVGTTSNGDEGQNSTFGGLTAIGGGGGSNGTNTAQRGTNGGSGGGAGIRSNWNFPGSGTAGQGYAGGNGAGSATTADHAGGGGGAGAPGGTGNAVTDTAGGGGVGVEWPPGSGDFHGGGGAGANWDGTAVATGGLGGGGNGYSPSGVEPTAGTAGSGGGGGGGGGSGGNGAAGGSGIVILAYYGVEPPTVDPVGVTDTVIRVRTAPRTSADGIGITDSTFTATGSAQVATITDSLGITDTSVPVRGRPAITVTDSLGITDTSVPVRGRPAITVTDSLGISDTVTALDQSPPLVAEVPSIDGASELPGIGELVTLTVIAERDPPVAEVPSIDGAAPLAGLDLLTVTDLATIAAASEVYAHLHDANGNLLSTLPDLVSVDWQDTHNDLGIGNLTLNRHDAAAAAITVGCKVFCYLYGRHVFTFVIESPPDIPMFDPGDEAAENLTVTGPGRVSRAEDALVYAPKGIHDPLNPPHRLYTFASVDYVEGVGWGPAVEQYRADQLDPNRKVLVEWTYQSAGPEPDTVELVPTPPPIDWPDPEAYWIWGHPDRTILGYNFFRTTFVVQSHAAVTFAVTGDNYHTLYLDGTPILGEKTELSCWRKFKTAEIPLAPGTYTLAAVVENAPLGYEAPSAWNPAGLLCSVFTTDVNGDPLNVLCRSDSSWRSLAYPATWPGWTPGEILIDIMAEAHARGEILDLQYDFTALTDSAGNAWPYTEGFSVPVGSSLLDALNSLVEQGWIDYRVAPGGLVMQAFVADWAPDTGVTLQVTGDPATTNLESLDITPQTTPKTRLFVRWSEGNFQKDDAAAQLIYGVLPMLVTLDAATEQEADRRATVILDNVKAPQDAIVASIAPVGIADRPYDGYRVGEKLTVPGRTGPSLERLLSLSVSHDGNGRAIIGAEFQTRIMKRERENEELLQQLGSGTSGSDKVRWSLYQTEPLNS